MKLDRDLTDRIIELMVFGSVCFVFVSINLFLCFHGLVDPKINNDDIMRFLGSEFTAITSALLVFFGLKAQQARKERETKSEDTRSPG